ncbi:MAG TPA: hypothetical protein VMU32_02055 [Solirubrobacteraceae bacterium]|nr:hypothetical protein [Solirubrobacteraceae bacterium]
MARFAPAREQLTGAVELLHERVAGVTHVDVPRRRSGRVVDREKQRAALTCLCVEGAGTRLGRGRRAGLADVAGVACGRTYVLFRFGPVFFDRGPVDGLAEHEHESTGVAELLDAIVLGIADVDVVSGLVHGHARGTGKRVGVGGNRGRRSEVAGEEARLLG